MTTLILNLIGSLVGIKTQTFTVELIYFPTLKEYGYKYDTYLLSSLRRENGIAWKTPDGVTVFETDPFQIFTELVNG